MHLLCDAQEAEYVPIFESADLILAQLVTNNYPCNFVRNVDLREKYGDRVRIWPNLYYSGYNPELFYLRGKDRKPLGGPVGDYHNKTFYEAWRAGLSVDEAVSRHLNYDFNEKTYVHIPEISLDELRKRESGTDVRIVDWIKEHMWRQRLFFTFNHPAQALIRELACRLVSAAGFDVLPDAMMTQPKREPLGQLGCPVNPWVARKYGCTFVDPEEYRGREVISNESSNFIMGKHRIYSIHQVVEEYFRVYDLNGKTASS